MEGGGGTAAFLPSATHKGILMTSPFFLANFNVTPAVHAPSICELVSCFPSFL